MGKHMQFREIEKGVDAPIWVIKINELLREKRITQQELADACGLPPSRLSDWVGINKKKAGAFREPRIEGFAKIARFFGVSIDYLLGENACKAPDDEEIHKILGLSDKAIQQLKRINHAQIEEVLAEKQICVLNYLLESLSDTTLFEDLYDYLIGTFSFPGKEGDMGAAYMVEYLPSGKEKRHLTFKEVFSQAVFVNVQSDLIRLKDRSSEHSISKEHVMEE